MPDDNMFVSELEIEVEAEITMAESSRAVEEIGEDPATWAFDPMDAERDEVGLRSLLGAVTELEPRDPSVDDLGTFV